MQVRWTGSEYLRPSLDVTGYLGHDGFWSPPSHVAGGMWKELVSSGASLCPL